MNPTVRARATKCSALRRLACDPLTNYQADEMLFVRDANKAMSVTAPSSYRSVGIPPLLDMLVVKAIGSQVFQPGRISEDTVPNLTTVLLKI